MADLVTDSVLPMPLQNQRFAVLESLLERLNGLSKHTIIMLTDITPANALPFFADHFSLFADGWGFAVTESEQRELIKEAIEIHRYKGTPWAIKRVLKLLGYGDCELIERTGFLEHNSSIKHDSKHRYGVGGDWTHYKLITPRLMTVSDAERIRNLLIDVAPLRCKLVSISIPVNHNSVIKHDGTYNYDGVIKQWL
ncbi:phage tail protein [Psychrobacter aquaticus]|uniref:Putative phage tail protein n=1 Tax=Psychrobacter aquaticus CMS 56 TaxID=1354303 RepID=U4T5F3_9GAMM|nr:phage tail protein [Psychrobacter aquaticus]ERL56125.1 putative phage tail protein [Psychrobacter aquaticus CMS 56]